MRRDLSTKAQLLPKADCRWASPAPLKTSLGVRSGRNLLQCALAHGMGLFSWSRKKCLCSEYSELRQPSTENLVNEFGPHDKAPVAFTVTCVEREGKRASLPGQNCSRVFQCNDASACTAEVRSRKLAKYVRYGNACNVVPEICSCVQLISFRSVCSWKAQQIADVVKYWGFTQRAMLNRMSGPLLVWQQKQAIAD
jgi:hypothetical protein